MGLSCQLQEGLKESLNGLPAGIISKQLITRNPFNTFSVNALNQAALSCLDENTKGQVEDLDMKAGVFPGEVWSASRQCQVIF